MVQDLLALGIGQPQKSNILRPHVFSISRVMRYPEIAVLSGLPDCRIVGPRNGADP